MYLVLCLLMARQTKHSMITCQWGGMLGQFQHHVHMPMQSSSDHGTVHLHTATHQKKVVDLAQQPQLLLRVWVHCSMERASPWESRNCTYHHPSLLSVISSIATAGKKT
jgi:hypothetical protein